MITGWFSLTVSQAWLIRTQRLRLHRQLGYIALGYAAVVIVLGTLANLMLISQIDSATDGQNIVVWGNFFTLLTFAAFVSFAVVFRKNPEALSRVMARTAGQREALLRDSST